MGLNKKISLSLVLAASFAIGAAVYFSQNKSSQKNEAAVVQSVNNPPPAVVQENSDSDLELKESAIPKQTVQLNQPEYPPLPNTPFLAKNEPLSPVSGPKKINRFIASEQKVSLDWFQLSIGPNTITQSQTDKIYSESRTLTNPLSLLIAVGHKISEELGLDFSWAQQFMSGNSSKNKIPKNRISLGVAWQPPQLVWDLSFLRWGLGIAQDDGTFIDGDPNDSRLSNYTKHDLYASIQYHTPLNEKIYLDLKMMLSGTVLKPSIFRSYTENGISFVLMPQYELSNNLKLGLGIEYNLKQKQLGITNHLNQVDSSDVESKEFRTSLSLTYTF